MVNGDNIPEYLAYSILFLCRTCREGAWKEMLEQDDLKNTGVELLVLPHFP